MLSRISNSPFPYPLLEAEKEIGFRIELDNSLRQFKKAKTLYEKISDKLEDLDDNSSKARHDSLLARREMVEVILNRSLKNINHYKKRFIEYP